ncbi:hypothetical protein LTR37_012669 [Vermiconidia calcicola]|uniref:Uncharacterized protein n=1 Tax=Vermiconidia calcicola TaxID=1690605 RepID=A0ACC3MYW3_9PEZI|nr:hypothetical protein LTR37_012669 [Vermiconidia calcicola]
MQSTRFLASGMLRQQATSSMLRNRAAPMLRMQPTRSLRLQATPKMRAAKEREDHAAHTISQRLRKLKRVPPELIPLGVVLGIAIAAAGYSLINTLFRDKTLRLTRSGPQVVSNEH